MTTIGSRLRTYGNLVAFSHTIFALPFAASALLLARPYSTMPLSPKRLFSMLVCMVTARTSAMAYNRFADRDVDAKNPRTQSRPIPSGTVKPYEALLLALASGLLFLISAASLGFWPAVLGPVVLAVLLGYSHAKRFTWAAHVWLGVALCLAPGGAWIATGAPPTWGIVALMVGVLTWLLGFDVLYSLQDEAFDRRHGLHSIPARFGTKRALALSAFSHVVTVLAFVACGWLLGRGPWFFGAVGATAALLVYEHRLVGDGNLEKIDRAFFDVNAYVSVLFFCLTALDVFFRG